MYCLKKQLKLASAQSSVWLQLVEARKEAAFFGIEYIFSSWALTWLGFHFYKLGSQPYLMNTMHFRGLFGVFVQFCVSTLGAPTVFSPASHSPNLSMLTKISIICHFIL